MSGGIDIAAMHNTEQTPVGFVLEALDGAIQRVDDHAVRLMARINPALRPDLTTVDGGSPQEMVGPKQDSSELVRILYRAVLRLNEMAEALDATADRVEL